MARSKCPSCGLPYDGKRCRSCLYEHFTEEIAHGSHVHEGEPLVIDAPVRKPIRRKNPFDREKRTGKRHPLAGFLVLLAIIHFLLPVLRNWGLELEAIEESHIAREAEPEPDIHIPESALVLYQDEEILVAAGWQENQEFTRDFPVYVRNDSSRDITVSGRDIQINGYQLEYSHLYCNAEAGRTGMGIFVFEERDKVNAGILAVQDIAFRLDIYDSGNYETIVESPIIELTAAIPEGAVRNAEPEGVTVYEQDGIHVRFLGFAYAPSAYDPYSFEDGALLFHIENDTQRQLSFSIEEPSLNGTKVDLSLWCDLPPGTKAVSSVYLYGLDDAEFNSVDDLGQFTFRIVVDDWEDYEFRILTDPISVTVTQQQL